MKRWLIYPARLREKGILGINRRNLEILSKYNPREVYPDVDNKLRTKRICQKSGIPVPETYCVVSRYGDISKTPEFLESLGTFVIKPACGSEGNGILQVISSDSGGFCGAKGDKIGFPDIKYHFASILSGLYSLGGKADSAFVEQYIQLHPVFKDKVEYGIPDIRIIVFMNKPVMAMLRVPTRGSRGRANLFQGGIGAGIDLDTGTVKKYIQFNKHINVHPDNGTVLESFNIPYWKKVVEIAIQFSRETSLGFIGVDIVVDAHKGPLLLEANARPGLSIQIANKTGLIFELIKNIS